MLNLPQLRALANIRGYVLFKGEKSVKTGRKQHKEVKRLLAEKPCSKISGVDALKRTLVDKDSDSTATPPFSHHNSLRLPLTFCTFSLGDLLFPP